MANTDHPCVVTIDHRSKPRVLFYGDQFMEVNLPVGTRVIYPKKPMAPLNDVRAATRYALSHPLGSEPLYAKLRPGMKVTIAVDDLSMPLPPMPPNGNSGLVRWVMVSLMQTPPALVSSSIRWISCLFRPK